jgi:uncharacterized SAM-dependent methyltransferase
LRPRLDASKNAKLVEIISAKTPEIHTSAKKLSALHKEDLKEGIHKSGNAVQTKAFYDRSGSHSAFEGKQLLAD